MVCLPKKQVLTFSSDNALSRLAHNAEDTFNLAGFVPNRRIGDVEVHILRVAVPLDVERAILSEHSLAGLKNAPQERFKILPQLRPILPRWPTKCSRMLAPDSRGVGVVVQSHKVRTPEQHDLRLCRQHKADGGLEVRRPGGNRSQAGLGPILRTDECAHLTPIQRKLVLAARR
jgi:hypothetical protein